jgi:hypothetical protein
VHGVTGSPAESTLDRPLVRRVAGDEEAGFFRPRREYGAFTGPGGAALEAYRWGNLTAGAAARALWLLLLPFMLANVAIWLRPARDNWSKNVIRALTRIFALSVTATLVLALVGISLDLVAWQCAGVPECTRGRGYLDPLAVGFLATPSRRLAALALIPILVISLLWYLGRRTWIRYETFPLEVDGDGDGMEHPCFWNGAPLVGRLRSIHVATAFGTLDAVLLGVLVPRMADPAGRSLAVINALLLVLCLFAVCPTAMMHRDRPAWWAAGFAAGLRAAALILTALVLGYAVAPRDEWVVSGQLPGYGVTLTYLFAAQIGLLALLGLLILAVRPKGSFMFGLAGPIVASLGLGVAVAFSAGMSFRVADFLNRDATVSSAVYSQTEVEPLQPPNSYEWASLGFTVLVVTVLVATLVVRLAVRGRLRRRARAVTDADFPGGRATDPARAERIDTAVAEARITDTAGTLLGLAYAPLGVAAVTVTALALAGERPVQLAPTGSAAASALSAAVNLGTYLIGLSAFGLVLIGLLAYRYQRFRKIVGVLWDLGTFWPRSAHPLAPPCYAERVVPELVTRVEWLAGRGGVILSGHSQGSVLAAATVLQLAPEARAATGLLTYGSPLRRLYARLFPSYVEDDLLTRIGDLLTTPGRPTRWVNLWRDTDPIGGEVASSARDERLVDPEVFGRLPGDTVPAAVHGHSGYQLHPAFGDAVQGLVAELSADAPVPSTPTPGTAP